MERIVVHESSMPDDKTQEISELLSMQFSYGLYEFDRERVIEDLLARYRLTIHNIDPPDYTLEDEQGRSLTLRYES